MGCDDFVNKLLEPFPEIERLQKSSVFSLIPAPKKFGAIPISSPELAKFTDSQKLRLASTRGRRFFDKSLEPASVRGDESVIGVDGQDRAGSTIPNYTMSRTVALILLVRTKKRSSLGRMGFGWDFGICGVKLKQSTGSDVYM